MFSQCQGLVAENSSADSVVWLAKIPHCCSEGYYCHSNPTGCHYMASSCDSLYFSTLWKGACTCFNVQAYACVCVCLSCLCTMYKVRLVDVPVCDLQCSFLRGSITSHWSMINVLHCGACVALKRNSRLAPAGAVHCTLWSDTSLLVWIYWRFVCVFSLSLCCFVFSVSCTSPWIYHITNLFLLTIMNCEAIL